MPGKTNIPKKPSAKVAKGNPPRKSVQKATAAKPTRKPAAKPAPKKAAPKAAKAAPKSAKVAAKPAKKPTAKPAAKKPAATKPAAKPPVPKKSAAKPATKKPSKTQPATKKATHVIPRPTKPVSLVKPVKLPPFLAKQRERLLALKDTLLDSMNGVARDSLHSRAEGSEASAFGMHQADAGSDAYDRDFALNLLSQEQGSLYEIDEALKRIEQGSYGVCEMSGKPIPHARLEALPFTRFTVECQAELEKRNRHRVRQPVSSLFGLGEEGDEDSEEDNTDNKD